MCILGNLYDSAALFSDVDILPDEKLQSLMKPVSLSGADEVKSLKWDAKWALRYQVYVKTRGVLASKGYVVSVVSSGTV